MNLPQNKSLFSDQRGKFYDLWEEQDAATRHSVIRERLDDCINYAKTAPFYLERLEKYSKASDHPLAETPPLNSEELRKHLPPAGSNLIADDSGFHTVFQSGGTTGIPKTSLFSHEELDGLNLPNARGFYATGLKPTDRVANLWAVGGLYMTFIHINRMVQQYGCTNFPFSNQTPTEFIKNVAELFNINVFTGITSVVLNTLRELYGKTEKPLRVEKIYFGGEHIYDADRAEMREKFGTTTIMAPGYGTVETWYLGYQCSQCGPGEFHVHDDQVYLEILDEESQTPSIDESIGILHATAFLRKVTPIIRYKVGDKAHWLKEPCSCGRTTPRFKLLGRGDDLLRIGYDSIDYNFIQETVAQVPQLSGMVQMEKQRLAGKDKLVLRIEAKCSQQLSQDDRDVIIETLKKSILQQRPSLSEFIKKGTVHPLTVEILKSGDLPTNPRTGKLIRVIDAI